MYSYSVEGPVVRIIVTGSTSASERESVLGAMRTDWRVPNGALLLIDATLAESAGSVPGLQERAHAFVQLLGPKMGPLCAVIVPPALVSDAQFFQAASGEMGVRVGVFNDERSAVDWLREFRTA